MKEYTPMDTIVTSYPDNHMTVRFHSDFSNDKEFKGFIAHYYADGKYYCRKYVDSCLSLVNQIIPFFRKNVQKWR